MPSPPPVFPPRNESPDIAEEREARIDEMLAKIKEHQEVARHGEDRAHHHLREAERHIQMAAHKKAEGPPQPRKRR